MTDILNIAGIGPSFATKLKAIGITSVEQLLEQGATRPGRKQIAEAISTSEYRVRQWVNHADLFRIHGVTTEYAELLESCGVDSVPELARRSPVNVQKRMVEVNDRLKLTRRVPTEAQVTSWAAQAMTLPRVVES